MSRPTREAVTALPRTAFVRWFASPAGQRVMAAGPFIALGLVLLMMWSIVAWFSIVYPQRLLEEYKQELRASASAAGAQTEAVLRDAEGNLRTLDLWLLERAQRDPLNDASLVQLTEALRDTSRGLVELMLGTPDGKLYHLPAQAGQPFVELPAADFIGLLASNSAEGTVLGQPLRLREGGRQFLPLAMRMSAPAGELQIAIALVDLIQLAQLLQPYAHGGEGTVALVRSDGLGLLRRPELAGFVGRNVFEIVPKSRQTLAADADTFLSDGSVTDGHTRLASYETLKSFGVKVVVAQGLGAMLGNHGEQRKLVLLLSSTGTVVALLITLALARMHREAREHDAMLLASSHASPLGLFRCDAQGRMTYANETYLRLHGFGPEAIESGWQSLLPDAERAIAREHWRDLISRGEVVNFVRPLRRPDGELRLFAIRTAPLLVNGRVVGAAGTVDDVTERVAQRKAETTLHAIYHQTPDYVAQFDLEGRLLYLNPAGRQRLDLGPDAPLEGVTFRRFFSGSAPERFLDALPPEALLQGHWLGHSAVLDPHGHETPMASTILVHKNERDQPETVSVILRDISALLLSQRERERSEAMLKAVAEAATTMISVLDLDERFLFFNRAFAERFGVRREDWLGRPMRELLGDEAYAEIRPMLLAALSGHHAHTEHTLKDRSTPVIIELNYAPLQRDSGEIEGTIGIGRDITAIKAEEARLRDASQTDPLTQLLNRHGFALRADEQLAHARQHNGLLTLIYLDLDRFKPVNDQHGHPVGDALLRAVAGRLRHTLRPQDLVARLGGDEFAVLLPALQTAGDAETVAAKLVRAILQPFGIRDLEISIGVSVGYCVAVGGSADLELMEAEADAKLYEAKRAGRGCYRGSVLAGDS
jgi:diguanylate cyclase (GGDEF)-like protein/PAS domain S-box-containing protein